MVKVRNMRAGDFEKRLQERNESVICFCAGYGLRELCEVYPQLICRICCIVDNYSHGKNVVMDSYEIPVISMEKAEKSIKGAIAVITSLKFADEIINQLDKIEVCDGMEVLVPALFWADDSKLEFKKNEELKVAKQIHYCWFGHGGLPEQFQKNTESWKHMCPDYKIIRWDETNYDWQKNKYMRQAYEMGKWGFVPDYARLDIINTYGGIYLDTDIELLRPLDDFLQFELFCGFEDAWSVNFGLGFGGTANNSILQEMMELYDEIDFIKPDKTLNLTASPVFQTQILARHGLVRNGSSQVHENFAVFSPEYFSPMNAFGYGKVTRNTCSIHQYAGTWFGEEQKITKNRMLKSAGYVLERLYGEI